VFEDAARMQSRGDLEYCVEAGEKKIGEKRASRFRSMEQRLEARRDRKISKRKSHHWACDSNTQLSAGPRRSRRLGGFLARFQIVKKQSLGNIPFQGLSSVWNSSPKSLNSQLAQRMSDTLQLVVDAPYTQRPRPAKPAEQFFPAIVPPVIFQVSSSYRFEWWERWRQAEAYRTFVEHSQPWPCSYTTHPSSNI